VFAKATNGLIYKNAQILRSSQIHWTLEIAKAPHLKWLYLLT